MSRLAVKVEDFPPDFACVLRRLRHGRLGRKKYSESYLVGLTNAIGQYLRVAQSAGLPLTLNSDAIGLFIDDLDQRELKNSTRLSYLASLMILAKLLNYPTRQVQIISEDIAVYREAAALEPSKKRVRLAQNPLTLGDIAKLSVSLGRQAYEAEKSAKRRRLFIMSGLLAFLSLVPLRIGDIVRLKVGTDIKRDHDGWLLNVAAKKTDFESFARLHHSLTPYLDRMIHFGQVDDFSYLYDDRQGTALFINSNTGSAYTSQNLSGVLKTMTGHGSHIVRTLVHDALAEAGKGGTDLALILCGQKTRAIAKVYEVHAEGIRIRLGQEAIFRIQKRLLKGDADEGTV